MSQLLSELLNAGLIERLEGDDTRFDKIEAASAALATTFFEAPIRLIGATLASLDPDVPANDPACLDAERALLTEWKSMRSVYPDPPINLYRAVLFDACIRVCEGSSATIVWLTAADTLRFARLGREDSLFRVELTKLARATEREATATGRDEETNAVGTLPEIKLSTPKTLRSYEIDRDQMTHLIAASVATTYRDETLADSNPYLPSNHQQISRLSQWSWEFADRMSNILARELEAAADFQSTHTSIHEFQSEIVQLLSKTLEAQQLWLKQSTATLESKERSSANRLNALWWSECLYSPSLRRSYRELPLSLAAGVMAFDLASVVTEPAAASVGYLLAETVAKLSGPTPTTSTISSKISEIHQAREHVAQDWRDSVIFPGPGRLSLRDLLVLALADPGFDLDQALRRAALTIEDTISLPDLAHAIFRQEQAHRLARSLS